MLEYLFSVYENINKLKIKVWEGKNTVANFGDVIEMVNDEQLLIAVYIGNQEALLMSEFWEFAREKDLIVEFDHPIAERWIIELDQRLYEVKSFNIVGKLLNEDIKLLTSILNGAEIPSHKSGPKVPPNTVDPRIKFGIEETKKVLSYNRNIWSEP